MAESTKTVIGKDVIESLTLGMYEDSRFVYREYIQNSADQIDKAVEAGILKDRGDGRINIEISPDGRSISIHDNATGIRTEEVTDVLKNIAQSNKDRAKDKGFRGIGRLGGLGYCDRLVFETSFKGEDNKTILTWDAKHLKQIINDRSKKEEATEVIDKITTSKVEKEKADQHYFKVTLEGVTNNGLLSKKDIVTYLSMVAPVPYNKGFMFRNHIYGELNKVKLSLDEYNVYVNTDQVFKAYTTSIYEGEDGNKKRIDEISSLQYITIYGKDERLLGWGWYGISNFTKQIPAKGNVARGLRLRKGNIQIGSENCLVKLFKESRGSYYFFGEVHAFDEDLIPNARRDYFLENDVMQQFESELKRLFHDELHELYYFASKIRNQRKHIDELVSFKQEYETKQEKGFTDKTEQKSYEERFAEKKERAKNATIQIDKEQKKISEEESPKNRIFEKIIGDNDIEPDEIEISQNEDIKFLANSMGKLSRREQKLVSEIFSIIDNVLPKELAENLKEKIQENFK